MKTRNYRDIIPTKIATKEPPQRAEFAANCRESSRGQEALLSSSCKKMVKSKKSLYLLFVFLASSLSVCLVSAQYEQQGGGYGSGSSYGGAGGDGGGHGGSGEGYETMDERPKLKLGIRVKIPAFRFELPRFSLPKITVSAKIRQPPGPRVIQLPEINFDTSSKSEVPNKGYGGGGGYAGGESQYSGSSYGGGGGGGGGGGDSAENTFEFSTQEDNSSGGYGQRKNYQQQAPQQAYNYNQQRQPLMRSPMSHHQQKQQYHGQSIGGGGGGYSWLNGRPSYQAYIRPPVAQQTYQYKEASKANADEGFNSPVYMGPQRTTRS